MHPFYLSWLDLYCMYVYVYIDMCNCHSPSGKWEKQMGMPHGQLRATQRQLRELLKQLVSEVAGRGSKVAHRQLKASQKQLIGPRRQLGVSQNLLSLVHNGTEMKNRLIRVGLWPITESASCGLQSRPLADYGVGLWLTTELASD